VALDLVSLVNIGPTGSAGVVVPLVATPGVPSALSDNPHEDLSIMDPLSLAGDCILAVAADATGRYWNQRRHQVAEL
jgi:hypothetical protein